MEMNASSIFNKFKEEKIGDKELFGGFYDRKMTSSHRLKSAVSLGTAKEENLKPKGI